MGREALMREIEKLAFVKTETELFLDTHPDCRAALDYYYGIVDRLDGLRLEYANRFGPVCAAEVVGERWSWVDGAWPWHTDFATERKKGER